MTVLRAIGRFYARAGLWALWGFVHFIAGGIYVASILVAQKFI